ncbi:MAG: SIMPL domain-containing protein, partial [bacterium]
MNEEKCCSNGVCGCAIGHKVAGAFAILVLVVLGFYLLGLARNSFKSYDFIGKTPDYKNQIAFNGTGKVSATPDVAVINIGVISEKSTVTEAQKDNNTKMNKIMDTVKSQFKVEAKDIKTDNYSIQPRYDWSNNQSKIIGYTVSQNVEVKVRNFDNIGDILTNAGSLGANSVNGPQFTIDDPTELKVQARNLAIKQAKDKANELAKQLGVKLGSVVSFTEGSGYV